MPRKKRPRIARLDQVKISRDGEDAIIVGHTSNQVIPANYTHLDLLYNGEQFHSNFTSND